MSLIGINVDAESLSYTTVFLFSFTLSLITIRCLFDYCNVLLSDRVEDGGRAKETAVDAFHRDNQYMKVKLHCSRYPAEIYTQTNSFWNLNLPETASTML